MNRAGTLKHDLREIEFALYLDELYGIDVTQGDTTLAIRKARARDMILKHGAADRIVAKGQTLGEAFHRVYGEALVVDLFTVPINPDLPMQCQSRYAGETVVMKRETFHVEHENGDGQ